MEIKNTAMSRLNTPSGLAETNSAAQFTALDQFKDTLTKHLEILSAAPSLDVVTQSHAELTTSAAELAKIGGVKPQKSNDALLNEKFNEVLQLLKQIDDINEQGLQNALSHQVHIQNLIEANVKAQAAELKKNPGAASSPEMKKLQDEALNLDADLHEAARRVTVYKDFILAALKQKEDLSLRLVDGFLG